MGLVKRGTIAVDGIRKVKTNASRHKAMTTSICARLRPNSRRKSRRCWTKPKRLHPLRAEFKLVSLALNLRQMCAMQGARGQKSAKKRLHTLFNAVQRSCHAAARGSNH